MVSESGRTSDRGPAAAAAAALQSTSTTARLPYRRPLRIFIPTVMLFVLMNYLAFNTEVDESGTTLVLPEYVREPAMQRYRQRSEAATTSSAAASLRPLPFHAALFFEETVMGTLFQVGRVVFRSHTGIQIACVIAWFAHFFELGVCFRICWSCNASLPVTLRYLFCVAVGGITQLSPLLKARDAWVTEVRASAAGAAAETAAAPKAKKTQ
ncbi:hypothetical protein NESM_000060400 [Novymonas esmeraldas]|uniref:Uncharacterized protein n=1 Tax=Novymonas esmeraldas TaxID=1808958 RepID=A0AAW0F4C0_9TRYP